MCINFAPLWAKIDALTFANLANVQTVGIGLYLALAVIQVVSASGVAGLRRRLTTLQAGVKSARLSGEFQNMHSLNQEIGALEIGFHAFNRTILWMVAGLFALSLVYFGYCTIWQDEIAGRNWTLFIFAYYLALPVVVFASSAAHISGKCRKTASEIKEAELRYLAKALG